MTQSPMGDNSTSRIASVYLAFAERETRGRSGLYETLARGIACDSVALSFLARFPRAKQQPNLLFAAMKYLYGTPGTSVISGRNISVGCRSALRRSLILRYLSSIQEKWATAGTRSNFDDRSEKSTTFKTGWRSEIDSNSRSCWLSGERADFRDFPFSAWETDRDQLRSAEPEKDRLPAAKRAMCVSAQRSSGQAPVL